MNLTDQPVELFIQQLTYLPFKDVSSACQTNKRSLDYCTNPKYQKIWKRLIDATFGDTFNYQGNLERLWGNLNVERGTYNYVVYTNLVKLLDDVTQLRIYHRQGDMDSFNSDRFTDKKRFITYFLLDDKKNAIKYLPSPAYQPFINVMNGVRPDENTLTKMVTEMAIQGSPLGISMMVNMGAKISIDQIIAATKHLNLETIKYLTNIYSGVTRKHYTDLLRLAVWNDNLELVKFFVSKGADISDEEVISTAVFYNKLHILKYLVSQGAVIRSYYISFSFTKASREMGRYARSQYRKYKKSLKRR